MKRQSRYDPVRNFEPDPLGRTDFRGLLPRPIGPATGVLEHMVRSGQRLDAMATDYFIDDRRWWRIGDANRGFLNAQDMLVERDDDTLDELGRGSMVGRTILVPKREE